MNDKEKIEFQISKLQVDTMNTIEKLERELAEARELLEDLVESIYTPSRLGIDSPPNPHWLALNNAKKYISKQKD